MARRTTSSGDDGGPAPKIGLALPPDEFRCQEMVRDDDGAIERCNRWTIHLPGGGRDVFCVSHSETEVAAEHRRKGVVARHAPDDGAGEHRQWLADLFAGDPWERPEDIRQARHLLGRMLLLREATATEIRELRAIVDAAERQMQITPRDWQKLPV